MTMPINPKINAFIDTSFEPVRHREQSVEESKKQTALINREPITNRGNSVNDKGEVIASRITNASRSPDKYTIGQSLVISLNDQQQ